MMNIEGANAHEIEQERQMRARQLSGESGEEWMEDYRPGSAGCHELLDRTALLADMLERHVLAHPACIARPEWYLLAEQAAAAVHALYQHVGAEHLGAEEPDAEPAE
jgi:hypothetical protein